MKARQPTIHAVSKEWDELAYIVHEERSVNLSIRPVVLADCGELVEIAAFRGAHQTVCNA